MLDTLGLSVSLRGYRGGSLVNVSFGRILAIVSVLLGAWIFRYDVQPRASSSGFTYFLLDRWTGRVSLCAPKSCRSLPIDNEQGLDTPPS
jgi:hypothetical protein